jgi:hypothetical protein
MSEAGKNGNLKGDYHAFLLRLWRERSGGRWHATLEHPQTGKRLAFANLPALHEYLSALTETDSTSAHGSARALTGE